MAFLPPFLTISGLPGSSSQTAPRFIAAGCGRVHSGLSNAPHRPTKSVRRGRHPTANTIYLNREERQGRKADLVKHPVSLNAQDGQVLFLTALLASFVSLRLKIVCLNREERQGRQVGARPHRPRAWAFFGPCPRYSFHRTPLPPLKSDRLTWGGHARRSSGRESHQKLPFGSQPGGDGLALHFPVAGTETTVKRCRACNIH